MKATGLASNDRAKARLRGKCKELLSRAEQIKKADAWAPVKKDTSLKAPVSQRAISRREEVILLEGSKLHGFIFPPWSSDPDDAIFEEEFNGSPYYKYVFPLSSCFLVDEIVSQVISNYRKLR